MIYGWVAIAMVLALIAEIRLYGNKASIGNDYQYQDNEY